MVKICVVYSNDQKAKETDGQTKSFVEHPHHHYNQRAPFEGVRERRGI